MADPPAPPVDELAGKTKRFRFTRRAIVSAIRKGHGIQSEVARLLGCDPVTVRRFMKRHPELLAIQAEATEPVIDRAEQRLFAALEDEDPRVWMAAAKYILSTKGKHRGWTSRTEVTGANGGPMAVATVNIDLTPESVRMLSAEMRRKLLQGDPHAIDAIAEVRALPGDDSAARAGGAEALPVAH